MDEAVRQALEIVKAQAGFRPMQVDEIHSMVQALTKIICAVHESGGAEDAVPHEVPKGRISGKSITCLECGKSYKLLTRKHLLGHGLTPEEYCEKWGYEKDQPLVCKELRRARSRKMKDMKLWEKRRKKTS